MYAYMNHVLHALYPAYGSSGYCVSMAVEAEADDQRHVAVPSPSAMSSVCTLSLLGKGLRSWR